MTRISTTKRNSQFLNKNSAYIQSLVSFILDTKPYHCKLTDVVEEYQFSDEMLVKMEERLYWRAKLDGVWMYDYYSSANANLRSTKVARLVSYLFNQEPFIAGVDENTDLALVPYAYSKKRYDGASVAAVKLERLNGTLEPMVESVDWFESRGAFEFRVQQTFEGVPGAPNRKFSPLWQSTMDDNVIQEARRIFREAALDVSNPNSNVNLIQAEMDKIRVITNQYGTVGPLKQAILDELDKIDEILAEPWLPYSYNDLYIALQDDPSVAAEIDFDALKDRLAFLTPRLFFGEESDNNFREGGLVFYRNVNEPFIRVSAITPDLYADYEEWTLTLVDEETQTCTVYGSVSGYAGSVVIGNAFSYPGHITFATNGGIRPAVLGDTVKFAPGNRMVIGPNAKLETWNLIKTNPFAFNRPYLTSKSYASIYNLAGQVGKVTLLSKTIPTSSFVITATNATTFSVTNDKIPGYNKTARLNINFNDGIIGFVIKGGTRNFKPGDKFIVDILNEPARVADLGLAYGFDMDAYDNEHLAYPNGQSIFFAYDGRFPVLDESLMRIRIDETAVDGRQWRIAAQTNRSRPIVTLKKNGTTSSAAVDLDDATSGVAPDPAANAAPKFRMDGTVLPAPYTDADLILYYADNFKLEYSDNGTTWTFVQNVNVDQTYNLTAHGISFIVPTLDKPYIVSSEFQGTGNPRVEGGDIFTFRVTNPDPQQMEAVVGLTSVHAPRIELHASGFYYAPDANWTVSMTSATTFRVSGVYSTGDNVGKAVPGSPFNCTIPYNNVSAREGYSFKGGGIQFTLVPNDGLISGDSFKFSTFADAETYVVHGSVTGYTGKARVGEYYWNGVIGFTIQKPRANISQSNGDSGEGVLSPFVTINRIRVDHDATEYRFTRSSNNGWLVTNDYKGVVKYVANNGTLELDEISIKINGTGLNTLVPQGEFFSVWISIDSRELFQPADLVIINPPSDYRKPKDGETVWIEKTTDSHLNIAINPDLSPNLSQLAPMTIDPRLIDIDTVMDHSILETSPELGVQRGFIPMSVERKDSTTSPAEFYDPAMIFVYKSAATGETIGTAAPYDRADSEDTFYFEWDKDFFAKYLPMNSSASLITQNGGWVDKMNVRLRESAKFMTGSAGTDQDFGFEESMTVQTIERLNWEILASYKEQIDVSVFDSPTYGAFGGNSAFTFLPGYDSVDYDGAGNYDQGRSPELFSLLSGTHTPEEINTIFLRWNPYLKDGYMLPLTIATRDYMQARLAADPNPNGSSNLFGIPYSGMGMDINDGQESKVGTSTIEDSQFGVKESGSSHDTFGYDTRPLDIEDTQAVTIYRGKLPPYANATYTPGMSWDDWAAPVETYVPGSVFQLFFPSNLPANLTYRIWVEGEPAPQIVAVVLKLTARSVQISIPRPAKVKLTIL